MGNYKKIENLINTLNGSSDNGNNNFSLDMNQFEPDVSTSLQDIQKIQQFAADKYKDPELGIRVTDEGNADYDKNTGEELPPSSRWENGEYTNEKLNGTSAIDLRHNINPKDRTRYMGRRVFIIGGKEGESGEDAGERVIHKARVLAKYDLPRRKK